MHFISSLVQTQLKGWVADCALCEPKNSSLAIILTAALLCTSDVLRVIQQSSITLPVVVVIFTNTFFYSVRSLLRRQV